MLACHARWQHKEGKKCGPIPIFSKQCVADSEERICGPLEASQAYILCSHAFKQGLISIYLNIYLYNTHTYIQLDPWILIPQVYTHPSCLTHSTHPCKGMGTSVLIQQIVLSFSHTVTQSVGRIRYFWSFNCFSCWRVRRLNVEQMEMFKTSILRKRL